MKQFKIKYNWVIVIVVVAMSLVAAGPVVPARADEDAGDLVNYNFAVWLGSGLYKVGSADKRFGVLRLPFAYTLRNATSDEPAFLGRLGFRLLLPALVGFQEETDTNSKYGAISFVPGLEVQIPVNSYWLLKPFAQFGAGKDTAGGDLQYIYGGGVRSLVSFPWRKFTFGIGNSVIVGENKNSSTKKTNGFSMVELGFDVQHPTNLRVLNRGLDVGLFFVVSRFFNRVDFLKKDGNTRRANIVYNVGLTLGTGKPLSIWKLGIRRVGINYRWGNAGFRGIGFNMGFPF